MSQNTTMSENEKLVLMEEDNTKLLVQALNSKYTGTRDRGNEIEKKWRR